MFKCTELLQLLSQDSLCIVQIRWKSHYPCLLHSNTSPAHQNSARELKLEAINTEYTLSAYKNNKSEDCLWKNILACGSPNKFM